MTFKELVKTIESVAGRMPLVSSIVRNDVFRLNDIPDATYGVFAWLQNEHNGTTESGIVTYSFTFFYVDRLLADKDNELDVQSDGMSVLRNILLRLEDYGIDINSYTLQAFNQRFVDDCAGVFARVTMAVPDGLVCPVVVASNGDYNEDYNEDFDVY